MIEVRHGLQRLLRSVGILCSFSSVAIEGVKAEAYCYGLVNEALTYGDGRVMILPQWRGEWTVVCNLNTTRSGVSPQTCFSWFAQLQTAVTQRRNIGIYYHTLQQSECATMSVYDSSPAPLYVRTPAN